MIQDVSANGTFVNGQRLPSKRFAELSAGDVVSFLPPLQGLEYEVRSAEVEAGAAEEPPPPAPAGRPSALRRPGSQAAVRAPESTGGAPPAKRPRLGEGGATAASAEPQPTFLSPHQPTPALDAAAGRPEPSPAGAEEEEDAVVDVDVEEEDAVDSESAPCANDIRAWVSSLDKGSLVQYEPTLLALFDDVLQIHTLYSDRLQDFRS